jgi:hypothetical protein
MAGPIYQTPNFAGGKVSASTATAIQVGGLLQGWVSVNISNDPASADPVSVWAVMDGSTPTAAAVVANGIVLDVGGSLSGQGGVMSLAGGAPSQSAASPGAPGRVAPQYWAACAAGTASVEWQERS